MRILALVLTAATPLVSFEAEAWGVRLARTGTLATLLPMVTAKETEELVANHKELSDPDKVQLRAVAASRAEQQIQRVMAVEGHAYASNLSLADLKALVDFSEAEVAVRFRAAQPKVIAETMQGLAGMDFKKDVIAAFCKQTVKGCQSKPIH